jgi:hypothetical protein
MDNFGNLFSSWESPAQGQENNQLPEPTWIPAFAGRRYIKIDNNLYQVHQLYGINFKFSGYEFDNVVYIIMIFKRLF